MSLNGLQAAILLQLDAIQHGCTEPDEGYAWILTQGYIREVGDGFEFTEEGLARAHDVMHDLASVEDKAREILAPPRWRDL